MDKPARVIGANHQRRIFKGDEIAEYIASKRTRGADVKIILYPSPSAAGWDTALAGVREMAHRNVRAANAVSPEDDQRFTFREIVTSTVYCRDPAPITGDIHIKRNLVCNCNAYILHDHSHVNQDDIKRFTFKPQGKKTYQPAVGLLLRGSLADHDLLQSLE